MKKSIIKNYKNIRPWKLLLISGIVSLLLAFLVGISEFSKDFSKNSSEILTNYFPLIFLNLLPHVFIFKAVFLRKIKENPFYAVINILYFLLLLPVFFKLQHFHHNGILTDQSDFFIGFTVLNLLSILIGHIFLFKYVFVDIIMKKRKPRGIDTLVVFLTYITLGVSFGFLYAMISIFSKSPSFTNMNLQMLMELGGTKLYFRHIYYSFITLTSVGYGDIYPISWLAQMISVVESILGVFLLSFSLGILLSTEEDNIGTINQHEELKNEIFKGIEELIDKKLSEHYRK